MATFNKFNSFLDNLCKGVINLSSDTLKVMLTNSAPVATNTIKGNLTDISAGNGYTAGGTATTPTLSNASGTEKLVCTDVVFAASGGGGTLIGPFQYVVLYDDTPTSPAKPLIGWYDNGTAVSMVNGETFTVDFDGTNGVFTLA